MTDTNEYAIWEALLAAKVAGQTPPPIDPNTPAVGFYRTRRKGQPYVPAWPSGWMMWWFVLPSCRSEDISKAETVKSWPWISKNPVSYVQYEFYKNNGRWEDADETVHEQMAENPKAVIGDNEPPDELALMKEQIDSASAGVKAYAEITDDVTQAKAAIAAVAASGVERGGRHQKRDREKAPLGCREKAVDIKWKPLVDAAKSRC